MSYRATITHFDTAMTLIEVGSLRLLTDPVFDQAGTSFDHGPVHLEKTSEPIITPTALGRIDAVLLSHDQHGDNLDHAGRTMLSNVPRVLTTPAAAARLEDVNAEALVDWQSVTLMGSPGNRWVVTAVPAQHGPDGTQEATGPVSGFVITAEDNSGRPIYISGDTMLFEGTRKIAARYAPVGLAIVHLGKVQLAPMGELVFSLSAAEAVRYAQDLKAVHVVPVHYEGWRHFTEGRNAAEAIFAPSLITDRLTWLQRGSPVAFTL